MKQKLQFLLLFLMLFSLGVNAQNRTVTGKVTNSKGEAIPGATVVVKGTSNGVVTKTDGTFTIGNVPADGILVIQAFGLETQEVTVGSQTNISVSLSDTKALDEVVVVGYGTTTKRNLTGSVSTIKAEDIGTLPTVSTFENALTGRTAGVQVNAQNGVLGAPVTVRIRGTASLNASSQPLYVLDGIPLTGGNQGTGSGQVGITFGGSGTNPLKNLNPSEIASIEVLKDAAASAIYGSRASNGVILITTKRGAAGKPKVNINYYGGTTEAVNLLDMMNGAQFTQIWNDAVDNRGLPAAFRVDPTAIGNTDFIDLVTRRGFVQELNVSVSGGDNNTKYFASVGASDAEGYIERNELQRFNVRLNLDQRISDKVSLAFSVAPSRSTNLRIGENNAFGAPITFASLYYPNVDARDPATGLPNLDFAPNPFAQTNGTPLSNLEGTEFKSVLTQIIANVSLNYQFLPYLSARTTFAVDHFQLEERRRSGSLTTDGFGVGIGDAANSQFFNYTWTNTLNYNQNFGDHQVSALLGTEIQVSENTSINVAGNQFADDGLKTLNSGAAITGGGGFNSDFRFFGIFSRATYSYKNRYIVSLTARSDGSSRFGRNNRFGFFPAASLGWVVSEESFMKGTKSVLSFLKLRASYGLTGNAQIGNFAALALTANAHYAGTPGFEPNTLPNPDLTWETTAQLDVALEWGLLDDRIRGSIGYYQKNTRDLLLARPLPRESGFTTITENVGEILNRGIEFEVSADIFRGAFRWTTSFNISTLQNEVVKLIDTNGNGRGNDIINAQQIIREGEPLGSFYVVPFAGVDPANGDALWIGSDGNPTNAYSTNDRVINGNPFPDFFGGFTNKFSYKGFDLSVFFQFTEGNQVYRNEGRFYESNLNSVFNQTTDQLNYWTPTNTNTNIPQPRAFIENGRQHSSRYLDDASFIRLKTLTFGYTFPKKWTKNTSVRLYAQGQNLLTFTDYKGFDPEVGGGNGAIQGNVFFAAPQARTITFGVNVGF